MISLIKGKWILEHAFSSNAKSHHFLQENAGFTTFQESNKLPKSKGRQEIPDGLSF